MEMLGTDKERTMAFADWKKRSTLFFDARRNLDKGKCAEIERACAAAYKAGERDGRKVAEAVAMNAIMLRQQLSA